jgi:hypothetical protein
MLGTFKQVRSLSSESDPARSVHSVGLGIAVRWFRGAVYLFRLGLADTLSADLQWRVRAGWHIE